jgi:hypothetical protein
MLGLDEFNSFLRTKKIVIPHNSRFKDTRPFQKYSMDAIRLVQEYLMPARTVSQLRIRVKNMASSRRREHSTTLSTYLETGILPELSRPPLVLIDRWAPMVPLMYHPEDFFPTVWVKVRVSYPDFRAM